MPNQAPSGAKPWVRPLEETWRVADGLPAAPAHLLIGQAFQGEQALSYLTACGWRIAPATGRLYVSRGSLIAFRHYVCVKCAREAIRRAAQ